VTIPVPSELDDSELWTWLVLKPRSGSHFAFPRKKADLSETWAIWHEDALESAKFFRSQTRREVTDSGVSKPSSQAGFDIGGFETAVLP
jgi:hypothetical protein